MDKATKSGGGAPMLDLQGVYLLVAEYSPLPTAVLEGATHLIRYVNPAFCRLVARESAELLAVPFSRAVPEGQAFLPHLDRVYQTGEAETYVTQVRSAPRPLYWSSAVWAIPGASSSPAGVIIQLTDTTEAELFRQNAAAMNQELLLASVRQHELTEAAEKMNAELQEEIDQRKNADTAVRESEERLSALITSSSDAVYSMSPDWKEMRQLHGRGFIPDTLAPSRNWLQEYIHPDDQPHVTAVINEAIRTKSIFELEHRVLRVDGALGWTFSRAVPLFDENGAIVEWFGTASDITERKHAEQFLQNARDELEMRVEEKTAELRQAYEGSSGDAGAREGRRTTPPGPEDGGPRHADRRHRPRLQQHPGRHHRLHGAGGGPRRQREPGRTSPREGHGGGHPRPGPGEADAHLQQKDRAGEETLALEQHRQGDREASSGRPRRRRSASGSTPEANPG